MYPIGYTISFSVYLLIQTGHKEEPYFWLNNYVRREQNWRTLERDKG